MTVLLSVCNVVVFVCFLVVCLFVCLFVCLSVCLSVFVCTQKTYPAPPNQQAGR